MSFLDKIVSWLTPTKRFTDAELLAGPESDVQHYDFHYAEEDYIRVLEARKRMHVLSERQVRIIDIRIQHLKNQIVDREVYVYEQEQAEMRRRRAEQVINEIDKRPTPSIRVPQPSSGGSTIKSGERLASRIDDLADNLPTSTTSLGSHSQSPASHSSSPSHSVSYSSHKSCHSSSYDGGSSSSSDSSSSGGGGCD